MSQRTRQPDPSRTEAGDVARRYFVAATARNVEGMVECWAPAGIENLVGQANLSVPDGLRQYFNELFAAMPDFELRVIQLVEQDQSAVVRWGATGTFSGAPFQGLEPTGARIAIEGCDVLTVSHGKIDRNDAYFDSSDLARQLGAMPPKDSAAEQRLLKAVNLKTRVARGMTSEPEKIAEGVWIVRGGFPSKTMNVFLVEDDGGITVFDAGIRAMTNGVAAAAAGLGGIKRVVLGHAHADHRGVAPGLGVPVYCHADDRADAESDGGDHYFDMSKLNPVARWLMPRLLASWDGGPVEIAGNVAEGDEIAGFRVVHLPGHAPGLIGLFRESDRLAITSDCFYTLNPETGIPGHARVPHSAFNFDTEQARASMRKLASLAPATAWPGHAHPVTGDVRGALEQAAAAT